MRLHRGSSGYRIVSAVPVEDGSDTSTKILVHLSRLDVSDYRALYRALVEGVPINSISATGSGVVTLGRLLGARLVEVDGENRVRPIQTVLRVLGYIAPQHQPPALLELDHAVVHQQAVDLGDVRYRPAMLEPLRLRGPLPRRNTAYGGKNDQEASLDARWGVRHPEPIAREVQRFLGGIWGRASGIWSSPSVSERRSSSRTSSAQRPSSPRSVTVAGMSSLSSITCWFAVSCFGSPAARSVPPATAFSRPSMDQRGRSDARARSRRP